ncbi:MAG: zinc ribbon domain-containing protein [Planctomycetes bacterium]|nr:zinc ribbon domain-containing protein [Planctomycetota bacterium]
MIPCPTCEFVNPLGTRFCRSCGGKLDLKMSQVTGSIKNLKEQNRADQISSLGRSIFSLSAFLFIFTIVVRVMVVPAMPIADLPPAQVDALLPKDGPAMTSTLPLSEFKRMSWRRDHASTILSGLGVDVVQLNTWQAALAASQKPDGSFPGDDPLAATGLATLALQAYPQDGSVIGAAAKARPWLQTQMADLTHSTPLARTLGMAALIDAEEITPGTLNSFSMYLRDGKAAAWQAFTIPLFNAKDRPTDLILLRKSLAGDVWANVFDALLGRAPTIDPKSYFTDAAKALKTGEVRLAWTFASWQLAAAPKDLTETIAAWSRTAPAPVDADTMAKCGPLAATAVAVLTIASPARIPPLWLQPR